MVQEKLKMDRKRIIKRYDSAFDVDKEGLISMMLDQFNEPLLSFREMIQNSIDEKSNLVDILIQEDEKEELLYVSIEDDGNGMSRRGIEKYLTLFDSTKEEKPKTIGEMGVGKIFAFALKPNYLVIETGKGSKGYKLVINKDLRGKLFSTPSRKGTKVTTIMPCNNGDYEYYRDIRNIKQSILDTCSYVPTPIKINGKKINLKFDIKSKYKVNFDDGTSKGVIGLTGNQGYKLCKGGILLEKGHELKNGGVSLFNGLEVLIDSFKFDQPLSRNSVKRDHNFNFIMHSAKDASEKLNEKLVKSYPFIKNNKNIFMDHLKDVLLKEEIWFLPEKIGKLNLFKKADGQLISYDEIIKSGKEEGTIYYSDNRLSPNEISYFNERNIPVLFERPDILKPLFHERNGLGINYIGDGLLIEGLTSSKKYLCTKKEENFLSILENFAYRIKKNYSSLDKEFETEKTLGSKISEAAKNGRDNRSSKGISSFNWGRIEGFEFNSFLDLNGAPREKETLYWANFNSNVILNRYNPYIKSMIKLSETHPTLSTYYTLCEIASSKSLFPDTDHRSVEDFIINLGQNLIENEK